MRSRPFSFVCILAAAFVSVAGISNHLSEAATGEQAIRALWLLYVSSTGGRPLGRSAGRIPFKQTYGDPVCHLLGVKGLEAGQREGIAKRAGIKA